jgi:hypothetical protein
MLVTVVHRSSFTKPGLELDSQFRLFLSSKPDVHFPLELLQLGLKVRSMPWLEYLIAIVIDHFRFR